MPPVPTLPPQPSDLQSLIAKVGQLQLGLGEVSRHLEASEEKLNRGEAIQVLLSRPSLSFLC